VEYGWFHHETRREKTVTSANEARGEVMRSSDLLDLLDARFDEASASRVRGSIAADERHHQPWGIVHGGLYTTAIETFATIGAYEAVRDGGRQAVGVANATDFLRPHRTGRLDVVATPIQQGRSQQLWLVEIRRPDDGKLVARGQVRLQNVEPAR
jgi:1,4-dihydroxy-2-naphthoyl-CoA hydrolase